MEPSFTMRPFANVEVAEVPVKFKYVPAIPAPKVEVAVPKIVVVAVPPTSSVWKIVRRVEVAFGKKATPEAVRVEKLPAPAVNASAPMSMAPKFALMEPAAMAPVESTEKSVVPVAFVNRRKSPVAFGVEDAWIRIDCVEVAPIARRACGAWV